MELTNSPENWLRLHGNWNAKKTVAKTNLFTVPITVLCEARHVHSLDNGIHIAPEVEPIKHVFSSEGRGLTCLACQTVFLDLPSQQQHFKSDFHRFNLKRNLKGSIAVTESEYITQSASTAKIDQDDENNSESSDDEDDEEDDNELDSTIDETDIAVPSSKDNGGVYKGVEGFVTKQFTKGNGPVFVFQRATVLVDWEFSLSIASFHSQSGMHSRFWNTQQNPWDLLHEQIQRVKNNTMSCVFLLRSGRFAGVVFEGDKIVIHKVLRRYTVRAKAGGGQSSHDNKGGKAKSAGAMLRRYGEQALKEDIEEILRLWSGHLQCCEAIHICAPKTMRSVFFDETAGSPLRKDDVRISYVPFLVDRPTLEEAKFVHARCTSVLFTKRDEKAARVRFSGDVMSVSESTGDKFTRQEVDEDEEDEEELLRGGNKQRRDKKKKDKAAAIDMSVATALASVKLAECGPSRELVASCGLGNDSDTVSLLRALRDRYRIHSSSDPAGSDSEDNEEDASHAAALVDTSPAGAWDLTAILNTPDSVHDMSTPLHLASAKSMSRSVALLLTLGADPTRVDVRGRPPYFLAADKETRDAYRRYRGVAGEDRHNWAATGVAAPLTEDMERDKKSKEKEKKKRAAQRKKEQKQQSEAAAKEATLALQREKQLQIDMAARRQTEAGQCGACGTSLFGIKSLDVYDRRCCSAKCVIALRRNLAASAAMKRFEK